MTGPTEEEDAAALIEEAENLLAGDMRASRAFALLPKLLSLAIQQRIEIAILHEQVRRLFGALYKAQRPMKEGKEDDHVV